MLYIKKMLAGTALILIALFIGAGLLKLMALAAAFGLGIIIMGLAYLIVEIKREEEAKALKASKAAKAESKKTKK